MKPFALASWVLAGLLVLPSWALPAEAPVDYNRDIRPILSKNCFACHGPDTAQRAAGLRLDHREFAVQKRKNGKAAIVPGTPAITGGVVSTGSVSAWRGCDAHATRSAGASRSK